MYQVNEGFLSHTIQNPSDKSTSSLFSTPTAPNNHTLTSSTSQADKGFIYMCIKTITAILPLPVVRLQAAPPSLQNPPKKSRS